MLVASPISWKSKKQIVIFRSSIETEYRVMTLAEVTWMTILLKDINIENLSSTVFNCDNQETAANPILHERTNHIEIDCHFSVKVVASCFILCSVN